MTRLRELHCTHVYKFTCEITMEQKFCNVIVSERKDRNDPYTYMKEDIITKEWLYETAVGLNNCQSWYDNVMDPTKTNEVFELPVSAVLKSNNLPRKVVDAPVLMFVQKGEGSCGISAFSSAFYFMFDKNLATRIYDKKEGYMNSLSEPACKTSKKAASLKFLMTTVINKYFKNYYVQRITKIMSWKDIYNSNECFHSIMICIIKNSSFSRDHMISIANG